MIPSPGALDNAACYRAVRSRDRRFEGRFVVGVTTTGIYCRPGCPARIPARRNIRFLPSPAAAELAGFRPCRRCRPDASPDSAVWKGTGTTIARALRLIDEGALDGGGVERLGARLGIGARHLRRLFLERLGAPPKAVALTRRAHFARQLVEETDLPMAAVAAASGFGSVRRFNGAMSRTFRCAPREFRRATARLEAAEPLTLRLPYRPPLDWESLLAFLAGRAIPGVEAVAGDRYRRTIRCAAGPATIEVGPSSGSPAVLLRVGAPPGADLDRIVRRVRRLLDLDCDPIRIGRDLGADPILAPIVRAHPGLRVPGCWDGFEMAVRAVLGQQVSVRQASTMAGRLVAEFGDPFPAGKEGLTHLFPRPETLARADLSRLGVPRSRSLCLAGLAQAVATGSLPLDGSASLSEALERLMALPGVGPWTAHYVAMRALGEPDAFPAEDLILKRAMGLEGDRLLQRAARWRPWRAYAAVHLWRRHAGAATKPPKDARRRSR
jgi:AraC family transcriptional regulator of adaptative response / DNA-3-methyladenine glycosylase II